jgi:hypothetical protein
MKNLPSLQPVCIHFFNAAPPAAVLDAVVVDGDDVDVAAAATCAPTDATAAGLAVEGAL